MREEQFYILYKGRKLSLQELMEEQRVFANQLEVPKGPGFSRDFVAISNAFANPPRPMLKLYIIQQKYEALLQLFHFARFSLMMAHQRLHKSPMDWQTGYTSQMFIRALNLFSAIGLYNNCIDYFNQLFYFFSQPDNYTILTRAAYLKEVKFVRRGPEKLSTEIMPLFDKLEKNETINKLRNDANDLKHRGNLRVKDFNDQRDQGGSYFNATLSNKDLEEQAIDIDVYCEFLSEVHVVVVEVCDAFHSLVDFSKNIKRTEKGGSITL